MPIVPAPDEPRQSDRAAGFAILAGLLLSLAFIARHPIPRSNSGTRFVAEVTHLALSNSVVHGSLTHVWGEVTHLGGPCVRKRLVFKGLLAE
jgi:hypothetical protein